MQETFYEQVAAVSFTLLGFWWAVVQFRYDEWMRDRVRSRLAYAVSLHLVLPGVMALASLLSTDVPLIWRLVFAAAGVTGFAVTLLLASSAAAGGPLGRVRAGQFAVLPIYAAVALVAVSPEAAVAVTGLAPRVVEGLLISALLLIDVTLVWALFAARDDGSSGERTPG